MDIDPEVMISSGAALLAVPLTWWLSTATAGRVNTEADRIRHRTEADTFRSAVTEYRAMTSKARVLTMSRNYRISTLLLLVMTFAGGIARMESYTRGIGAAAGETAALLARERHEQNRNMDAFPALTARLWMAAAPVLRHPDPQVVALAELAMNEIDSNDMQMMHVLDAFDAAMRAAEAPAPSLLRRAVRRLR